MLNRDDIYESVSARYDELIAYEDCEGELARYMAGLDLEGKDIADLGAGTGRLTCLAAPKARTVAAVDFAADMLRAAAVKLEKAGLRHWTTRVADLRQRLPLEDRSLDVVMAGWSLCYLCGSGNPDAKRNLDHLYGELRRVLRPGGRVIIFETLSTGVEAPAAPHFLEAYFRRLEHDWGLASQVLYTGFRFEDKEQAKRLAGDFFGEALRDKIEAWDSPVVPSWTGVWSGSLG
ncbi:methyltransferase domain-containing protein [Paenibacillus aurantius]|uniref:Methyltransferase domain-containing protein n=1 Tax=Paenibacillus aurantius TaxID=2918900 RepID=A0AA96LF25_9BACL|nr:methyltransferase domain-containing protein [Paenibacillus aurantius]WNQ10906.1 methyltransferase domain-containing protein [Paenibacillus aurantius]